MMQFFERKPLAWILDPACDRAARAQILDLHILVRVEVPAIVHCIDQHFAKSVGDLAFLLVWQFHDFDEVLHKPLSGSAVTANQQPYPSGGSGDNLDAIVPTRFLHGYMN